MSSPKLCLYVFFVLACGLVKAQTDSSLVLTFDFNDHTFNEKNKKLSAKPVGVFLTDDRFGNDRSAVFIQGSQNSYLNLGTSPLLKAKNTTISLWVKLSRRVYMGKGYDSNPIFITKNGPGDDFIIAYYIGYDGYTNRFASCSTKDSTKETAIMSLEEAKFNQWHHFVITSDNKLFAFYINGELQGKMDKDFETKFLESDSVVIGHSASKKNHRFSQGVFDDIQIYHRALTEKEVKELYNAPNPNRFNHIVKIVLVVLGALSAIFALAFVLVWQRRRSLKKEQDKLELNNRMHEMEIRTLKAQMNPHFIFNSLNSIQQFILLNDNDKAQIYLSKFSKLIRRLLESNANEGLTLKEEIEILQGYLEIEALRFGHQFKHEIVVDEKLSPSEINIPHLMIQPFVENAIWHGLLPKKGDREITIRFYYISQQVLGCSIDDNGVGREQNKTQESTFKQKSLALSFVSQRLELMGQILGVTCGVNIIDKKNQENQSLGTRVELTLPITNKNYVESSNH